MSKGSYDQNISKKKNYLSRCTFYSKIGKQIRVCDKKSLIITYGFSRDYKNSADIHSVAWIFISDCDIIFDKYTRDSRNAKGHYIVNIDVNNYNVYIAAGI